MSSNMWSRLSARAASETSGDHHVPEPHVPAVVLRAPKAMRIRSIPVTVCFS